MYDFGSLPQIYLCVGVCTCVFAPEMTMHVGPHSTAVEEGSDVQFYCAVYGNVVRSLKWSKEIGSSKVGLFIEL